MKKINKPKLSPGGMIPGTVWFISDTWSKDLTKQELRAVSKWCNKAIKYLSQRSKSGKK